jgi:L-cysteine:1D-myo-inositol 2-amino-2-deoxy-alpha-D-glucopyranoside ligase
MSKSRGNLVFVRDALKEHDSNTLRWYLLTKHYRDEFHYQRDEVARTAADVAHLREAMHANSGSETPLDVARARQAFDEALGDDLHTAQALAVLSDTAAQIRAAATEQRDVSAAQATLAELADVLGIRAG